MNYIDFRQKFEKFRVFSTDDIRLVYPDFHNTTLHNWTKKNYIKKIRNEWYIFADLELQGFDYYLIANKIYSPSYISLETALNHYGVIPEAVLQHTSIGTNKTNVFETDLGVFRYQKIAPELFFGYEMHEYQTFSGQKVAQDIKIASLEKTVLDYLYLHHEVDSEDVIDGLRFNKEVLQEGINKKKLAKMLQVFDSEALANRVEILFEYLDH